MDNFNYNQDALQYLKYCMIKSAYKKNPTEESQKKLNKKIDDLIDNNYKAFKNRKVNTIGLFGVPNDGKTTVCLAIAKEVSKELELDSFFQISQTSLTTNLTNDILKTNKIPSNGTLLVDDAHLLNKEQQDRLVSLMDNKNCLVVLTVDESKKNLLSNAILSRVMPIVSKGFVLRQINDVRQKSFTNSQTGLKID